jgi:L-threonylcarbamoyladenylate synthase
MHDATRAPDIIDVRRFTDDAAVERAIADAATRLRAGELVAFPTETVYGLGANALDAEAVARIFAAKGRPSYNPVIAHVADVAAAQALVTEWPDSARDLVDRFWPGPLTLVLPARTDIVPDIVRAGLPSVGVRVPAHPVALALLRATDRPIAAPSANRFTEVSPTTADHVARGLGARVGRILDGGPCGVGIESTVLDLSGTQPTVLRPGTIGLDALSAVLGTPVQLSTQLPSGDTPRTAPGMIDRHYAPHADVWLVGPEEWDDVATALEARAARGAPGPVHAIVRTLAAWSTVHVERLPDDPAGFARALYAALHEADAGGAAVVIIERPPDEPAWTGVRDRIERAAR